MGVPYGLGAGSVGRCVNNFVALHYPARHMSWLHCMWGVGASVGPVIMGWAITGGLRWNGGYFIISILQIILTAILFITLPLWKKKTESAQTSGSEGGTVQPVSLPIHQIIKRRGVKEVMVCFFCYCSLEMTTSMWAASYCTINRGIDAETAATWASLFISASLSAVYMRFYHHLGQRPEHDPPRSNIDCCRRYTDDAPV